MRRFSTNQESDIVNNIYDIFKENNSDASEIHKNLIWYYVSDLTEYLLNNE